MTPTRLVSTNLATEQTAYANYNTKDRQGFFPLQPIATGYRFAPGSTFKVVTSTAAYNLAPTLANFNYPGRPLPELLRFGQAPLQ